jgi:hypothetical protein
MINENSNVYKKELQNLYDQYGEWDWFCSMRFGQEFYADRADIFLKRWQRKVCKEMKVRVCYVGLHLLKPEPHLHLLMTGLDRVGYTLAERKWSPSEDWWVHLTRGKGGCIIKPIDNPDMVAGYINKFDAQVDEFELLTPYNLRLLKKKREIRLNPELAPPKTEPYPYEWDRRSIEFYKTGRINGQLLEWE